MFHLSEELHHCYTSHRKLCEISKDDCFNLFYLVSLQYTDLIILLLISLILPPSSCDPPFIRLKPLFFPFLCYDKFCLYLFVQRCVCQLFRPWWFDVFLECMKCLVLKIFDKLSNFLFVFFWVENYYKKEKHHLERANTITLNLAKWIN